MSDRGGRGGQGDQAPRLRTPDLHRLPQARRHSMRLTGSRGSHPAQSARTHFQPALTDGRRPRTGDATLASRPRATTSQPGRRAESADTAESHGDGINCESLSWRCSNPGRSGDRGAGGRSKTSPRVALGTTPGMRSGWSSPPTAKDATLAAPRGRSGAHATKESLHPAAGLR